MRGISEIERLNAEAAQREEREKALAELKLHGIQTEEDARKYLDTVQDTFYLLLDAYGHDDRWAFLGCAVEHLAERSSYLARNRR